MKRPSKNGRDAARLQKAYADSPKVKDRPKPIGRGDLMIDGVKVGTVKDAALIFGDDET